MEKTNREDAADNNKARGFLEIINEAAARLEALGIPESKHAGALIMAEIQVFELYKGPEVRTVEILRGSDGWAISRILGVKGLPGVRSLILTDEQEAIAQETARELFLT